MAEDGMRFLEMDSLTCLSMTGVTEVEKARATWLAISGRMRTRSISFGRFYKQSCQHAVQRARLSPHTIFIASLTPFAIWVLSAALTSCFVMFSNDGRTEFCTSALTACSTTRVVFFVNSVDMSFKIFSWRMKSAACSL